MAFEYDAGVKIPLLLMESTAHIKFGNGQFTANIASSGFLGIFKTDLQILANSKKFELTATSTLDFKQAVDNVAKAVDTAIEAAFDGMLKITEYVDKLNDYISKGIDRLCSVLGLDKIKIELPGASINVCDGMKKFASGVTKGINDFLKPVLNTIKNLVSQAMKALFSALGAILNVSGQSTFKVTIAGRCWAAANRRVSRCSRAHAGARGSRNVSDDSCSWKCAYDALLWSQHENLWHCVQASR